MKTHKTHKTREKNAILLRWRRWHDFPLTSTKLSWLRDRWRPEALSCYLRQCTCAWGRRGLCKTAIRSITACVATVCAKNAPDILRFVHPWFYACMYSCFSFLHLFGSSHFETIFFWWSDWSGKAGQTRGDKPKPPKLSSDAILKSRPQWCLVQFGLLVSWCWISRSWENLKSLIHPWHQGGSTFSKGIASWCWCVQSSRKAQQQVYYCLL